MTETVEGGGRLEVSDGADGIRVLTLDRPARRNALTPVLLDALAAALGPAPHVRAIVLRSSGPAFCAGYDLANLDEDSRARRMPDARIQEVLALLEAHPAPSVAVLGGAAFGAGLELACACDFRVGGEGAVFCLPPARLGLVYAPQGLWRLVRLVGFARAKRMALTGVSLTATEAERWGLLDGLVDDVEEEGMALAGQLAAGAPLAVAGMKRAFGALGAMPLDAEAAGALERLRAEVLSSADFREGQAATREKRPPRFRGA